MNTDSPQLPWLEPPEGFPPIEMAWGQDSAAPGLLCAGGNLSVNTLRHAYRHAIFPWFSGDQPILWWSPNPRMVLEVNHFKPTLSLKKTLRRFRSSKNCEVRVDTAFHEVINACANSPRGGQSGTWIVPQMIQAYGALHRAGTAHSVEIWVNGHLVGGLYFVAIGLAVFGESMFHRTTDASKIALAALVCMCRRLGVSEIDCQQNTQHLASLGACEMPRATFANRVQMSTTQQEPVWQFAPVYWSELDVLKLAKP